MNVKEKAFEWSVDYKPFEENLTAQEYARYGFEIGYKRASDEKDALIKDLKQYIIDTDKYGIDSDTIKSRVEQYKS